MSGQPASQAKQGTAARRLQSSCKCRSGYADQHAGELSSTTESQATYRRVSSRGAAGKTCKEMGGQPSHRAGRMDAVGAEDALGEQKSPEPYWASSASYIPTSYRDLFQPDRLDRLDRLDRPGLHGSSSPVTSSSHGTDGQTKWGKPHGASMMNGEMDPIGLFDERAAIKWQPLVGAQLQSPLASRFFQDLSLTTAVARLLRVPGQSAESILAWPVEPREHQVSPVFLSKSYPSAGGAAAPIAVSIPTVFCVLPETGHLDVPIIHPSYPPDPLGTRTNRPESPPAGRPWSAAVGGTFAACGPMSPL